MVLPELIEATPRVLRFARVDGRHAVPGDLDALAAHLGRTHAVAYARELHSARLDQPYTSPSGLPIASFTQSREETIKARLREGVPYALLDLNEATGLLTAASTAPAAFYKDTNPRNILITSKGPVMVDFDDLTLAPFGYDLAKLIVTTAMTYGRLPNNAVRDALATYNAAIAGIAVVSSADLNAWAELHHILTNRYLGRGGYRYRWDQLRPAASDPTRPLDNPSEGARNRGSHPLI